MKEDYVTSTEHDAALWERRRGEADDVDPRPTRAELDRDECQHDYLSEDTRVVWVCDDCGQQVCDE